MPIIYVQILLINLFVLIKNANRPGKPEGSSPVCTQDLALSFGLPHAEPAASAPRSLQQKMRIMLRVLGGRKADVWAHGMRGTG